MSTAVWTNGTDQVFPIFFCWIRCNKPASRLVCNMGDKKAEGRANRIMDIDRRWFAAVDFSMFAAAMIVKPRRGFGKIFPAVVASPWLLTATGHYFDDSPKWVMHVVSGIGYSLLTLHSLILTLMYAEEGSGITRGRGAIARQFVFTPLMIGLATLNFKTAVRRF